nr:hypothetical protein [Acidobacteriota bacterium]
MADLIVLPTLERLIPYDAHGQKAVGLVFSVALERATTYQDHPRRDWLEAFLKPWSWVPGPSKFQSIEKMHVYCRSADEDWGPAVEVRLRPGHGAPSTTWSRALRAELDSRFLCFKEQGGSPWVQPSSSNPQSVRSSLRPWPAFIGHLSLFPWPVPQALGLSFFARLNCPRSASQLVAAPVLTVEIEGGPVALQPQPPTCADGNPDLLELAYEPWCDGDGHTLEAKALTVACKVDPDKRSTAFFDLGSLWVKNPARDLGLSTDDFRGDLETRLAGQLHLARVIVDWMRDQLAGPATRADLAQIYPEAALRALQELRRITVPALSPPSQDTRSGQKQGALLGGKLLRRLASRWRTSGGTPFSAAAADQLDHLARPWFDAAATEDKYFQCWLGLLTEATAAAGGTLPVVTAASEGEKKLRELPLADTISQLDSLLTSLTSPALIQAVWKGLWQDFLTSKEPSLKPPELDLAKAFANQEPAESFDLARELLVASVGRWQADGLRPAFAPDSGIQTLADSRQSLERRIADILRQLGQTLRSMDADWREARACQAAEAVLPDPTDPGKGVRATRGLTVQVDTLSLDPGDTAGEAADDDRLRDIQGVALLMRRAGSKASDWCCLNLAEAWIGSEQIACQVLLPSRLAYAGGLRAPTLTYDNQPLAVAGPLAGHSVAGTSLAPDGSGSALDEPLIDFRYAPAAKLPQLLFGQPYEIVPFLVTNSGAIPQELTKGGREGHNPWEPKPMRNLPEKLTGAPLPRSADYRREVHVGALRFLAGPAD